MKRIVIDTNILVSAALSPIGKPAKIANLISNTDEIKVYYSKAILSEYQRVLGYKRLNIALEKQEITIKMLQKFGVLIEPPVSTIPMSDETDRIFYDVAKASGAILITGNTRHFPGDSFIMTPSEFLLMSADNL